MTGRRGTGSDRGCRVRRRLRSRRLWLRDDATWVVARAGRFAPLQPWFHDILLAHVLVCPDLAFLASCSPASRHSLRLDRLLRPPALLRPRLHEILTVVVVIVHRSPFPAVVTLAGTHAAALACSSFLLRLDLLYLRQYPINPALLPLSLGLSRLYNPSKPSCVFVPFSSLLTALARSYSSKASKARYSTYVVYWSCIFGSANNLKGRKTNPRSARNLLAALECLSVAPLTCSSSPA